MRTTDSRTAAGQPAENAHSLVSPSRPGNGYDRDGSAAAAGSTAVRPLGLDHLV